MSARNAARSAATASIIGLAVVNAAACSSASSPVTPVAGRPPTSAALEAVLSEVTSPPPAELAVRPRALLIGDSTLLAVERYAVLDVFRGFDYVYSAKSCRTLGVPSCGDAPVPPNAVEAIERAGDGFDVVVVMAGYDEWWTSFPTSFDRVITAARATGASTIIWLTYREGVGYVAPDGSTANEAFVKNNQTVSAKIAGGGFDDVVIADWKEYSSASSAEWLAADGIHLTPTGARAVADYISRTIASRFGLPCPMPWVPGGVIDPVCSDPDLHIPVTGVIDLYP